MNNWKPVLASTIISIGIMISGLFLSYGYIKGNIDTRYVTVKGVSEKEVVADTVLWPIKFVTTNNDMVKARADLKESEKKVIGFLNSHYIKDKMISIKNIMVKDKVANAYSNSVPKSRFIINETIMVRTNNPDIVVKASQDLGGLIDQGVVLSQSSSTNLTPFTGCCKSHFIGYFLAGAYFTLFFVIPAQAGIYLLCEKLVFQHPVHRSLFTNSR